MQFVGQGKGDEIPYLMWIWVVPFKKEKQDEMNAEQKLNVY